jgi:GT2 family glycosyltransferase
MSWMRHLVAGIRKACERFGYEQTPLAFFFGNVRIENVPAEDHKRIVAICELDVAGEKSKAITVPSETRLHFKVWLPPGTSVSSWVGLGTENDSRWEGSVEFGLGVETAGSVVILSRCTAVASPRGGHRKWRRISADLSAFAGREVSLVLQTSGGQSGETGRVAFWGNPRLLRKRSSREKISKIGVRLQVGGISALFATVLQAFHDAPGTGSSSAEYQRWIRKHALTPADLDRIQREIEEFRYRPVFSVITPVHNTDSHFLTQCIESVRIQLYPHWELSLFDDGSTQPGVLEILRRYEGLDSRIKVGHSPTSLGISRASNEALAKATGDYVVALDHDDELALEALYEVAKLLQKHAEADIIYSDEDKLELDGTRSEPFFKPDWSPEYLLSCMYTSHLGVYRRELVNAVGPFRTGFEGCQDYDLMLRLVEQTQKVFHIPKILYHWRKVPGSTAGDADAKPYKTEAARRALEEHTRRRGLSAEVLNTDRPHAFRVKFGLIERPLVSIIIPVKDGLLLRDCLNSIIEKTRYPHYEITIVDNGSTTREMKDLLAGLKHPVIPFPGPFNFSRINNVTVQHTKGKYLLFLNFDTRVISPDWITALLEFTQQREIGITGAKLYYPDGRIQHAGVILGLHGVAGHSHRNFSGSSRGYFNALFVTRNCSAVTAACMMIRREVFELVGGFDEHLAVCYNDVDLCLRVREAGFRIVWTPYAELYHHEGVLRGYTVNPKEVEYMKARWGDALLHDPYYNENLTLHGENFDLRL